MSWKFTLLILKSRHLNPSIFLFGFFEHVIECIAGYVIFQISKSLECKSCLISLSENPMVKANLILAKNRGGLTQPSWGVVEICRQCENEIRSAMLTGGACLSTV